jgi:hypothetical protein
MGTSGFFTYPGNSETQEDLGLIPIRHIRGDAFNQLER